MKTICPVLGTTILALLFYVGGSPVFGEGELPITLEGVPPDQEVSCDAIPPPAHVTVSGGCFSVTSSDGLLLHYTFNNPDNLGFDSSGRGNHGLAVGPMADADGVEAGACRFTGGGSARCRRTPPFVVGRLGEAGPRQRTLWCHG